MCEVEKWFCHLKSKNWRWNHSCLRIFLFRYLKRCVKAQGVTAIMAGFRYSFKQPNPIQYSQKGLPFKSITPATTTRQIWKAEQPNTQLKQYILIHVGSWNWYLWNRLAENLKIKCEFCFLDYLSWHANAFECHTIKCSVSLHERPSKATTLEPELSVIGKVGIRIIICACRAE